MTPNGFWAIDEDSFHHFFLLWKQMVAAKNSPGVKKSVPPADSNIAVIPIHGVITPHDSLYSEFFGASTVESIQAAVTAAQKSRKVTQILYDIYSPGGSVDGINELAEQLAKVSKPTAVYIGALGASAAYWLATAASQNIFIDRTASVGSIGVLHASHRNSDEIVITSSHAPNKHVNPNLEEGQNLIREQLDIIEAIFIETVAANRGVSTDFVQENFGKGGLVTGQSAVSRGMVSAISSYQKVMEFLLGRTRMEEESVRSEAKELDARASSLEAEIETLKRELLVIGEGLQKAQAAQQASATNKQALISLFKLFDDERDHRADYKELLATCLAEEVPVGEAQQRLIALRSTFTQVKTSPVSVHVTETLPVAETYMSHVNHKAKSGLTLAQAMKLTASEYPDLHEKWLAECNQGVKS